MASQTHHRHHLIALLLLLFLSLLPFSKPDLQSDKAALLAFKTAVRKSLPWNSSVPVCQWLGIQCESSRVTVLRLPANALIGVIPPATIGNLTALRTLSLRLNALTGPLPSDIARCAQPHNLYLSPFSPSPSISAPKKFSPSSGPDPILQVTKVVKGGKQLQFKAGDKQGRVGVGVGKGKEVTIAIEKSARDTRRNIITVSKLLEARFRRTRFWREKIKEAMSPERRKIRSHCRRRRRRMRRRRL